MQNNNVKVSQFKGRNGAVKNQFIVRTNDGVFFQSYDSLIAGKMNDGKTIIDQKYWDYSKTTGKYRNQFLNETKKETEKKLADGIYLFADLN